MALKQFLILVISLIFSLMLVACGPGQLFGPTTTPTPTSTLTPTLTPSITPTPTATYTPSPTPAATEIPFSIVTGKVVCDDIPRPSRKVYLLRIPPSDYNTTTPPSGTFLNNLALVDTAITDYQGVWKIEGRFEQGAYIFWPFEYPSNALFMGNPFNNINIGGITDLGTFDLCSFSF